MEISTSEIQSILQSEFVGTHENFDLQDISIDSRSLRNTDGILFFAINGKNHDAHAFIPQLIAQGIKYMVVEKLTNDLSGKINYFIVKNSIRALQDFAIYYRHLFHFPIIGITGSNGKTIVKEWLNTLLENRFSIIKSPKSYNSQVGVPISVIGINEHHNLGLFEAGISTTNEMEILGKIIDPEIGIITNIGSAHDEGFEDKREKISEKIKLFSDKTFCIIPNEADIKEALKNHTHKLIWGFEADCDIIFSRMGISVLNVKYNDIVFEVNLPFTDDASVQNICTCIATLLYMQIGIEEIKLGVQKLKPLNMRMQVKKGINNCLIIDDSYSSDYQSFKIALDVLHQQKSHQNLTVILSDILQSGFDNEVLYEKIAKLLHKHKINNVIGIGATISTYLPQHIQGTFFENTAEFLAHYNLLSFSNESILIKGSRIFSFEKIVEELEEKTHETVLEINLDHIAHNYQFYKSQLKQSTKMMVMIKAFGYGNGSFEIAKQLEHLKADYLGVAFADEGVALRKAGITMPIMIMNPERNAFSQMMQHDLEPEIYSFEELDQFYHDFLQTEKQQYNIHIKVNTGMNRLGFEPEEIFDLGKKLVEFKQLKVKSIFSHLAASDDATFEKFTLKQIHDFENCAKNLSKILGYTPLFHILNTGGVIHYPQYQMDMVRIGLGLYGIGQSEREKKHLKPVSTLKSVVLQIRKINANESVGYSRRYSPMQNTQIATIPIGYADGIRRSYGNGVGHVFINGKKYPIVGAICMDMLMVDVGSDDIKAGDEVEIFGENITIAGIANLWQTIPYEVMTSVSQRVKRIFFK